VCVRACVFVSVCMLCVRVVSDSIAAGGCVCACVCVCVCVYAVCESG